MPGRGPGSCLVVSRASRSGVCEFVCLCVAISPSSTTTSSETLSFLTSVQRPPGVHPQATNRAGVQSEPNCSSPHYLLTKVVLTYLSLSQHTGTTRVCGLGHTRRHINTTAGINTQRVISTRSVEATCGAGHVAPRGRILEQTRPEHLPLQATLHLSRAASVPCPPSENPRLLASHCPLT